MCDDGGTGCGCPGMLPLQPGCTSRDWLAPRVIASDIAWQAARDCSCCLHRAWVCSSPLAGSSVCRLWGPLGVLPAVKRFVPPRAGSGAIHLAEMASLQAVLLGVEELTGDNRYLCGFCSSKQVCNSCCPDCCTLLQIFLCPFPQIFLFHSQAGPSASCASLSQWVLLPA